VGATKVGATEVWRLDGLALPPCTEYVPLWEDVLMEVARDEVQPLRSPVSNPPLTITLAGLWLTTSVTEVEWLRLPLVPVMVIGNAPIVAVVVVVAVGVGV